MNLDQHLAEPERSVPLEVGDHQGGIQLDENRGFHLDGSTRAAAAFLIVIAAQRP
jgi:hypothetical protein